MYIETLRAEKVASATRVRWMRAGVRKFSILDKMSPSSCLSFSRAALALAVPGGGDEPSLSASNHQITAGP
jgi:hypothetical protein